MIRQSDELIIPSIITQHPNMTKTECLTLLICTLSEIKLSLPVEYQSDVIMRNKILNSIKDINACKLTYQKSTESIQAVISDIHSALAKESNNINESVPSNFELYYSDPRMNRNFDQNKYENFQTTEELSTNEKTLLYLLKTRLLVD